MPSYIKILFVGLTLLLPSAALADDQWGDLSGKIVVRFRVSPAPSPPLKVQGESIADESLLVAQDGGLINAVIYVATPSIAVHPELAANAKSQVTMTLKNYRVQPRGVPVWVGRQSVLFENREGFGINLNVQPLGDQAINPLLRPGESASFNPACQQTVPVPVGCNIHSWLRGYIVPRENPYVAVTDAKGTFKLAKLPAQLLEFQLWHEKFGYLDTPQQPKGRFTRQIKPGQNDLGTIVVQR